MRPKTIHLHFCILTILLVCLGSVLSAQTFNGVSNLPVPPVGSQGITESDCNVSGIGVIGGCVKIDYVTLDFEHTWVGDIGIFSDVLFMIRYLLI